MQDLNITVIQSNTHWEDKSANMQELEMYFTGISLNSDIIVLPEMFSTGFSMNTKELAEPMDGTTVKWMQEQAKQQGSALVGSIIIEEDNQYYNRLLWVNPDGSIQHYDKGHLFRFEGEDRHFTTSGERVIIEYKGWRFLPQVCYDLRFPVWSRNKLEKGQFDYDCIINVANWPAVRSHHWRTLLLARAIENQAYVVSANRVGTDGNKLDYSGGSMVIDPAGQIQAEFNENEEGLLTYQLSWVDIKHYRDQFKVSFDWDEFSLE